MRVTLRVRERVGEKMRVKEIVMIRVRVRVRVRMRVRVVLIVRVRMRVWERLSKG